MLDDTVDTLVQCYTRLRRAEGALARANQENDRQRKDVAELRRAIRLIR